MGPLYMAERTWVTRTLQWSYLTHLELALICLRWLEKKPPNDGLMAMNPIVESKNITLNKHKYSTVEGFYIFFR